MGSKPSGLRNDGARSQKRGYSSPAISNSEKMGFRSGYRSSAGDDASISSMRETSDDVVETNLKEFNQERYSVHEIEVALSKTDNQSVFEKFMSQVTFSTLIYDDIGLPIFKKHCSVLCTEKIVDLWRIASRYRETFDPTKMEETIKNISNPITKCFMDKSVVDEIDAKEREFIEGQIESGTVQKDLLDTVQMKLMKRLEQQEYESWRKSKYAFNYFSSSSKLSALIADDHAMYYFEKFLAQEYSSENVDFFEATKAYCKNWKASEKVKNHGNAVFMFRLYISEEAPLQVNIPSKMRVEIERKLFTDKIGPQNIFDEAKAEVLLLMSRDSWNRFKRSSEWEDYSKSKVPRLDPESGLSMSSIRRTKFHQFIGDSSFEDVLQSHVGRDCLAKFVQVVNPKDGSVQFWYEGFKFKKNNDIGPSEQRIHAQVIYENYISSKANVQVNIPIAMVKYLKQAVEEEVSNNLFDSAMMEVMKDMKRREIFMRFKMTGLYTKYRLLTKNSSL